MNRRDTLGAMCGLVVSLAARPLSAQTSDGVFDALLAKYVKPGADGVNRVDYARWTASAQDLTSLYDYISHLAARTPSKMPRNDAFAFWCNLYNAVTLKVVLDRYPSHPFATSKARVCSIPKLTSALGGRSA